MSEGRYSYSDDIESIVDMKDSTDGLGIELTTSDVVLRLNQLEEESEALREELADSDMELLDSVIQDVVFGDIFRLVWKHANLEKRWLKQQVEIMGYDTDIDALLTGEDESMSLSEVKEKYLPNRDIEELRKKPDISLLTEEPTSEPPASDVPATP